MKMASNKKSQENKTSLEIRFYIIRLFDILLCACGCGTAKAYLGPNVHLVEYVNLYSIASVIIHNQYLHDRYYQYLHDRFVQAKSKFHTNVLLLRANGCCQS